MVIVDIQRPLLPTLDSKILFEFFIFQYYHLHMKTLNYSALNNQLHLLHLPLQQPVALH
jgi:hypothetical protein